MCKIPPSFLSKHKSGLLQILETKLYGSGWSLIRNLSDLWQEVWSISFTFKRNLLLAYTGVLVQIQMSSR